ncbi:hypothetical protein [Propionicicella superfundia]|uniref:hypothetical protein n=1 Tax=Propionicicella superfundia TaxID=348582 RepID=UPI00041F95A3|nr:hypothetical protein [Propionicicella superfundia]
MRPTLVTWGTLPRHLKPAEVARDLVILVLVGALAGFAVLYCSRGWFDRLRWESGLDYAAKSPGTNADGLTVATSSEVSTSRPADDMFLDSMRPTTWIYPDGRQADVARLVAGNLVEGTLRDGQAVLDQASAATLGVGVGDELMVEWAPSVDEEPRRTVTVSGIVRPFHLPDNGGNGGLLILSATTAEQTIPGLDMTSLDSTTYDGSAPSGVTSQTHLSALLDIAFGKLAMTPFLWSLILIGLAIWLLGVARVTRTLVDRLSPIASVIVDLGQTPLIGRLFAVFAMALLAGTAAAVASWAAREFIMAWTRFYVTSAQLLVATGVLAGLAVVFTLARTRQVGLATTHRS